MNQFLSLILVLVAVTAQTVPNGLIDASQCKLCYAENKSVCLTGKSPANFAVDVANCCSGTGHTLKDKKCLDTRNDFYCSSNIPTLHTGGSKLVTNPQMQQWSCPANTTKCPNDAQIYVTNSQMVTKSHTWNQTLPDASYDWNCKYRISINKTSQANLTATNGGKKGFLTVQIEQYGFSGSVSVIGQKNGLWIDYVPGQSSSTDSRVYTNVTFGQKLFFPSDWDVLINFEPTQGYPNQKFVSKLGKFLVRTAFQGEISQFDKLHIQPTYVAYNQALLAAPPVEQNCTLDKTKDNCIETCSQNVKQDKCSCKDYPLADKCKSTNQTCEEDNSQPKCLTDCETDPTQDFCVFSCQEQPGQNKCKCRFNPRLDKCLCPEGSVRSWNGKCIYLNQPWRGIRLQINGGGAGELGGMKQYKLGGSGREPIIIIFTLLILVAAAWRCFVKRQQILEVWNKLTGGNNQQQNTAAAVNNTQNDNQQQQANTDMSIVKTENSQAKLNVTNDKIEMGIQIQESHNFGDRDFGEKQNIDERQIDCKEEVANDIYQS